VRLLTVAATPDAVMQSVRDVRDWHIANTAPEMLSRMKEQLTRVLDDSQLRGIHSIDFEPILLC
jgi:hypothetical protein